MKLDALLVSAFLVVTGDCFAPLSPAAREVAGRASFKDGVVAGRLSPRRSDAAQPRRRPSRKRPRARASRVECAATVDGAAFDGTSSASRLPHRLQEAVDRLDREPDLVSKSKLLVELGDAFALTGAAVLPRDSDSDGGALWRSQKVPGCVSEVHVAVKVATEEGRHPGGGVVSIRGTADARLSRGILALLAVGLEGETADTVLGLRGKALAAAVGLRAGLTDSRINGLGNVLGVIQNEIEEHLALALGAARISSPTGHVAPGVQGAALDQARSWGSDASDWFPLPGAEDEVAMLLSGGVDSSVALRLLQDEGYRIRAFYLKIWLEDELSHLGECPWEEDLAYASAVCEQAGVPLEVVPLQREYWEQVVSYTVSEARDGRTPNPDVMCNSRIKFGMFYDHVGRHFRHVATGHYARLEHAKTATLGLAAGGGGGDGLDLGRGVDNEGGSRVRLLLSPDAVKDQTYFLCALNQAQLRKALFPVGGYTKERIRELAENYNLPTKNRKDSQGICFLGKLKFDDFLRHYLGEAPGAVVDRETGQAIGEHRGLWFHTIGQRKGVGPGLKPGHVNLGPWYVSGKDMDGNVLEVTNDRDSIDGPRESFQVEALRWIAGRAPAELEREGTMRLRVKTRHGPQMKDCVLRLLPPEAAKSSSPPIHTGEVPSDQRTTAAVAGGGGGRPGDSAASGGDDDGTPTVAASTRGYVRLETKDSALAPGQFAAFYVGEECVGAGVISDYSGVDCFATAAGLASAESEPALCEESALVA